MNRTYQIEAQSDRPNWLPNKLHANAFIFFFTWTLMVVLTFKNNFYFNNGLINFYSTFFLNLVNF